MLNKKNLLLIGLYAMPIIVSGQNEIPVLSNVSVVVDTSAHSIEIDFDLSDTENDSMEVWIQASSDAGLTWVVDIPIDSLNGNTGFPELPGTGKQIIWEYDPTSGDLAGINWSDFRIRLIADDRQSVDLNEVFNAVDSIRVIENLQELEGIRHRTTNLAKLEQTKDSLEAILSSHNLNPVRQGSNYGGYMGENIIGLSSGTRFPRKTWMISGHFDTVDDSPGADDNGTAVVTVAEAIRVLSNFKTKHSIRYFFFDLEEPGLVGSNQYLSGGIPSWEQMQGLLNMDGIGFFDTTANAQSLPAGFGTLFPTQQAAIAADSYRGNFLVSIINTNSAPLDSIFESIVSTYEPGLKVVSLETPGTGTSTPDFRRSDHAGFWDLNVPAMFFTDGANYRNPHYHEPTDSINKLDLGFLMQNIRSIITMLANQAILEHSGTGVSGAPTVQGISSVKGSETNNQLLQIFPNPTSGIANLSLSAPGSMTVSVNIFDATGAQVFEIPMWQVKSGQNIIELKPDLTSGSYIVKVEGNGIHSSIQMIIVE
jgi:hypothetical protein